MINKGRFLRMSVSLAAFVGVASCNNDKITEINQNPNSPEDVPASTLFTSAAQTAVGRFLGAGYSLREAEFLIQHFAEQQYPDEDRYARLGAADTQGSFTNPFNVELEDLTKLLREQIANRDKNIAQLEQKSALQEVELDRRDVANRSMRDEIETLNAHVGNIQAATMRRR
jgi:hypothetical protein